MLQNELSGNTGRPNCPVPILLVAKILRHIIENSKCQSKHQYWESQLQAHTICGRRYNFFEGKYSLQATLNVLETFGNISGLEMNTEKN